MRAIVDAAHVLSRDRGRAHGDQLVALKIHLVMMPAVVGAIAVGRPIAVAKLGEVAVGHVRVLQRAERLGQGLGVQQVVMVELEENVALSLATARALELAEAFELVVLEHAHARVFADRSRHAAAVVLQNDPFPVLVRLREQRLERGFDEGVAGLAERSEHGDHGPGMFFQRTSEANPAFGNVRRPQPPGPPAPRPGLVYIMYLMRSDIRRNVWHWWAFLGP